MENKDIKVSVCCMVYNHEKYLRKCLDGFVMQKTNFAFEVLINDDKSTDSSAEIIKEYYEKYPNIFVPIFQTENQYSKGISILDDILYPMTKGKYIALCEGDDYWCDENKLQLQYDYMESDPECVMCLHNSIRHYLDGSRKDRCFNNWKEIHVLDGSEAFYIIHDYAHTSSFFFLKKYAQMPIKNREVLSQDIMFRSWLYTRGKLVVLPQVLSVYNYGVENGATATITKTMESSNRNDKALITYFEQLNVETNYKYDEIIRESIKCRLFSILLSSTKDINPISQNKKEVIRNFMEITSHSFYPKFMQRAKEECSWVRYMMIKFKYEGYVIYPLWKLAYLLYYGIKQNKRKSQ